MSGIEQGAGVRLLVCATCRDATDPTGEARPGARLAAALDQALGGAGDIAVEAVECLSVCKRPCTVALTAPGRWTYIYGDLDPETEAAALIAFARRYGETPDGIVPWKERPASFRKGVVARLPPLSPRQPASNQG